MTKHTLADAELAVMELLWEEGAVTARTIRERLYADSDRPQHGTVQRLLQRLEGKGFVVRNKEEGSVQTFSPLISRSVYACEELELIADKLAGGSLIPLITSLVDERKLTGAEILHLRQLLEEQ